MSDYFLNSPLGALDIFLRTLVRWVATLGVCLVGFGLPSQASAHTLPYCTGSSTLTFSPTLPSTIYYKPKSGTVAYAGTATWTVLSCNSINALKYLHFTFEGISGSSTTDSFIAGIPGLTTSLTGFASGTCGTSTDTATTLNTANLSFASTSTGFYNATCTLKFPFQIVANSNASASWPSTSITATQIREGQTTTTGWTTSDVYLSSTSLTKVVGLGKAVTFIPAVCTGTVASQTIALPAAGLNNLAASLYSGWIPWSLSLSSCDVTSSTAASVTFTFTGLDGDTTIVAPDTSKSTTTHVGVQIGYGGEVFTSGTAKKLGDMTSASTSYTYTLQARYAVPSGQTPTSGTLQTPAISLLMTYL